MDERFSEIGGKGFRPDCELGRKLRNWSFSAADGVRREASNVRVKSALAREMSTALARGLSKT